MKVSLNIIRQYIDFELPPVDDLVERINTQLGGVEEVTNLNTKYKDAKIVKVIGCEKHPNADKLSLCKIDAGTHDLIQIVCGAPNVHAGVWAVWLPPESIVPATFNDETPFLLSAREIRGEMSNGMLASARELAIGDGHDGIVDISETDLPAGKTLLAGASFAELFGLDDYIIDIENKMFTHRPDLFGQLGVAREIAGILGEQFTSPDWYLSSPDFPDVSGLELEVFNDTPEKAPRFMAVAIKNVEVKPSPFWLQCALIAMGSKPINNIVDATNYIMLLTAQPTHAYDYDKIRGAKLGVRMATSGEKLPLLNGRTYELADDDIVIADSEGPIGLAGIMGGGNSEVSSETKNIVLEVATFDMYTVRKSSMRHGIFTDALTRFNKGQSPFQNDHILHLLMTSIKGISSAEQASRVFDLGAYNDSCVFVHTDDPTFHRYSFAPQGITETFINSRLGLELDKDRIATLLRNVEFKVTIDDKGLDVHYPFWRTDIVDPEDIVEEVGRLYGYKHLPKELPKRSIVPAPENARRRLLDQVRSELRRAGVNEVVSYSFVHERTIKCAGQNTDNAYKISNALSPDLQYYRLSLTPSLLDKIHPNIKAGYSEFALLEIGKVHSKPAGLDDEGLPVESRQIALSYANKANKSGAAYYQAKAVLEFLASQLHLDFTYETLSDTSSSSIAAVFEPKRTAIVSDKNTGLYVGLIGEYKTIVQKNFKLPAYAAGFELSTDALLELAEKAMVPYEPLRRFPVVGRIISIRTDRQRSYAQIFLAIEDALKEQEFDWEIAPLGVYSVPGNATKNTTFRLSLFSKNRTLQSEEVNNLIEQLHIGIQAAIGAEII